MTDDLVQSAHGAMDVTVELGIAAKVHDDMTGKPNTMADSIRRGIAEIERLRSENAAIRQYNEGNQSGGPAKMFAVAASRICAGESVESVMEDYGLCVVSERDALQAQIDRFQDESLGCLSKIRWAIGDHGKRMQDELVEYIANTFVELAALRKRIEDMPKVRIGSQSQTMRHFFTVLQEAGLVGKTVRLVVVND